MPYHLVPVLHKADEALQLGWTLLQEGSLQLREAGGELALSPQGLTLLDKLDVDFRVRSVASGQLTCWELIHNVKMSALLWVSFSPSEETSSLTMGGSGKVSRPRARRPEGHPQSSLLPSPLPPPRPSQHHLSPGHSRDGSSLLPGSSTAHSLPSTHRGLLKPDPSTSCFPGHLNKIQSPRSGPGGSMWPVSCHLCHLTSCLDPFATYSPGYFTSSNMPSSFLSQGLCACCFLFLEAPDLPRFGFLSSLGPRVRGHLPCCPV